MISKGYILFHLQEAHEELTKVIAGLEEQSDYDEISFGVALTHLYNHVNTAWNAREATNDEAADLTREQFYQWRAFPQDIDMGPSMPEGWG